MNVGTHKKIFKRPSDTLNDRIELFRTYIRNQKTKLYQNSVLVEKKIFGRFWISPYPDRKHLRDLGPDKKWTNFELISDQFRVWFSVRGYLEAISIYISGFQVKISNEFSLTLLRQLKIILFCVFQHTNKGMKESWTEIWAVLKRTDYYKSTTVYFE